MLAVSVDADRIRVGDRFAVALQRTLRVPDDGSTYPLPPGLGALPIERVREFRRRVPRSWRADGFFVPLYQREALWLRFEAAGWKPNAVQVAIGGINAVTGEPWSERLQDKPQNYLVCPGQPWLDGINTGEGTVRQFVAVALGAGDSVEEQLTGAARLGGLQLRVYEPKPGRFPDRPRAAGGRMQAIMPAERAEDAAMGIAAGGSLRQKIYPDPHGIDTWDQTNLGEAFVYLVNSRQYEAITGRPPPPTPIDARLYTEYGLPWFSLYDDDQDTLPAGDRLGEVESLAERDRARGVGGEEADLPIAPEQVIRLDPKGPASEEQR
jgi:hypothetical protein